MLSCAAWWWILLEIAFQPVRRRYMILFVTKNKRHHSTEGRRNLSKDTMCRAYHGKDLRVCPRLHKSQHLKGWKIYLLYEFLFKLCRIKHIYIFFSYIVCCQAILLEIQREPYIISHCFPLSPPTPLSPPWCRTINPILRVINRQLNYQN